ncbi:MAG: HNH endonuclease [Isosphaeraceae bacterium]
MRRYGTLESGLLRHILDVIYEHDQCELYDADSLTSKVAARGFWDGRSPLTPEKTVASYLSQNPDLFSSMGSGRYKLRPEHYRLVHTALPMDCDDGTLPPRTESNVYRFLRETALVKRLKIIHKNRCQICGIALCIGNETYSEGHHIKPLSRQGPDAKENILILCPNHHAQCDYGGIQLEYSRLRHVPDHRVSETFIDWYNHTMYKP